MKHRLSISLLAISASLVVGSSAMAAPGVAYKRRLDVPKVPASVLSQITKTKNTEFTTSLSGERDCKDVIYRSWSVAAYNPSEQKIATVIEARTNTNVMWKVIVDEKDDTLIRIRSLYSCRGRDLILNDGHLQLISSSKTLKPTFLRHIRYASFQDPREWTSAQRSIEYTNYLLQSLAILGGGPTLSIDGIDQVPGLLVVENGQITGDSRPITFDQKTSFHLHTLPRYRDLTTVPQNETVLALFFRMSDGYLVAETITKEAVDWTTNSEGPRFEDPTNTYYRIRNGEAHYTKVEEPGSFFKSTAIQYSNGHTLFVTNGPKLEDVKTILVHGLPKDPNHASSLTHESKGSILWETEAQVYMRYLITEKKTGKQQYWEATVNKQ